MNVSQQKIGLGLAALGRPGYINLGHSEDFMRQTSPQQMEQRTHAMLDAAWTKGVRYFDAARSYGMAEKFLSTWLLNNPDKRQSAIVGSKWGYTYSANWSTQASVHEIKEHSLQNLEKQWTETREHLAKDLDYYFIHSATLESKVLDNLAVLTKLAELKEHGVIVGLSVSGPQQGDILEQALNIQINGTHLFGAIQVTYNLLETSTTGLLQHAHQQGIYVVIKEGVANGLLTARNTLNDHYIPKLQSIAEEYNTSIDAIALASIVQQTFVSTVLSGASTKRQLQSNLHASSLCLSAETINALQELKQTPQEYWHNRSQLAWN